MTKQEFKALETVCKKNWRALAKSGDNRKPDDLNRYYLFCPACDVAYNVRLRQNLPHEQICLFCPIVVWRDGARKQEKMHKDQFAMCEFGKFPYYRDWNKADSTQARRFAAAKIAKMRWEWIPEYENIYKEQEEQPWPISKQ